MGITRRLPPSVIPRECYPPPKKEGNMPYKTPKALLVAATALPAAIEAMLPAGAPKLSVTLADIAEKLPDLPATPEFPEVPIPPGGAELKPAINVVEVKPEEVAAVETFGGGYRPLQGAPQIEVIAMGGGYRPLDYRGEVGWQKRSRESKEF